MEGFVTAFLADVTLVALWAVLTGISGVITLFFLFAIAIYFLRRVIRKGSKAKAGI